MYAVNLTKYSVYKPAKEIILRNSCMFSSIAMACFIYRLQCVSCHLMLSITGIQWIQTLGFRCFIARLGT